MEPPPPLTFETGNALRWAVFDVVLLVMCKSIKRIIWTSTLTLCAALNPNEGHLPQRESKHDLNSWTSNWVCMKNLQGLCGFVLSPPFLPCCVDPRLFAYDEHPFPHWVTQPKHGILSSRPETCFPCFSNFALCKFNCAPNVKRQNSYKLADCCPAYPSVFRKKVQWHNDISWCHIYGIMNLPFHFDYI